MVCAMHLSWPTIHASYMCEYVYVWKIARAQSGGSHIPVTFVQNATVKREFQGQTVQVKVFHADDEVWIWYVYELCAYGVFVVYWYSFSNSCTVVRSLGLCYMSVCVCRTWILTFVCMQKMTDHMKNLLKCNSLHALKTEVYRDKQREREREREMMRSRCTSILCLANTHTCLHNFM